MSYTISQVAERTGISIYTLRYYDKEGLLPFIHRERGKRVFEEQDIDWIDLICCLKNTGMPIKEIRSLIAHCMDHGAVLEKGMDILLQHKRQVEERLKEVQRNLKTIDYKMKHLPRMIEDKFNR
ncbi:MerR family transcriptional regulator [Paenibacillus sp. HB172176]|uniref:MerR family transcriptional regulator n=1 Tax=Paenibacillus sp. HB172176 TaxID=2493690 RepID=UPI00143C27CA|nr:MerR family transcriptional regulator [Paenibacillus sp. HB172176]